ncbi:MAG TPA: aminotransferase class III-fold pyridoxal phosphate-dependent enzyme [Mycobacteriales bacterium]|nr:aminotransferase class III-fold pyridoxal phosphate-dependent enzyme [Mycobacteriales bacterium]
MTRAGNRMWHPFADMAAIARDGELVITRGEGAYVFDEDGRRYLDATAGLWFCNVGYGRAEIAAAVETQLREMPAYSTFGDFANRPAIELAEVVSSHAPIADSPVFFTNGGSDSVDTAIKLARRYWHVLGHESRTTVLTRQHAYHGMHVGGTSVAGIEPNRVGYGALLGDVERVPWDDSDAVATVIDQVGAENVAAFLCEPVIGAGGVMLPPDGYLKAVREICHERDVLFVADEVITGFGRAGDWFASSRFGLDPDMVLCAKGLTSGYVPMGAVIVAPRVAEPFWDGRAGIWRHGYTYSGHAGAAAAGLANLALIEAEDLPARARQLESTLAESLGTLTASPLVSEVRAGLGLLAAVQLDPALIADNPGLPARTVAELRRHGVLTRALATGGLQISPSLVIDTAVIDELTAAIGAALEAVQAAG